MSNFAQYNPNDDWRYIGFNPRKFAPLENTQSIQGETKPADWAITPTRQFAPLEPPPPKQELKMDEETRKRLESSSKPRLHPADQALLDSYGCSLAYRIARRKQAKWDKLLGNIREPIPQQLDIKTFEDLE